MHQSRLIILERSGSWAAALRGRLPTAVKLREVRSFDECLQELDQAGPVMLGLELTAGNAPRAAEFLADFVRRRPEMPAVVFADAALATYEELMREAGAVHFTTSRRNLTVLADLADRHFARYPQQGLDAKADILARLPWARSGSAP